MNLYSRCRCRKLKIGIRTINTVAIGLLRLDLNLMRISLRHPSTSGVVFILFDYFVNVARIVGACLLKSSSPMQKQATKKTKDENSYFQSLSNSEHRHHVTHCRRNCIADKKPKSMLTKCWNSSTRLMLWRCWVARRLVDIDNAM